MEIEINYLAVLAAAVAVMVIGTLWYGPVFGKPWRRMMGYTPESMKAMKLTAGQAIAGGIVTALLKAYVLAHVAVMFGAQGFEGAFMLAFWMWLGLVMPTLASGFLWENKPFKLFAFNAAHGFVELLAIALVLVLWV
ncbi:MAG: DUF1761 domain-containing protein [Candidatus Pacebacteria bacterium]|nr:DUF1761 domain-containing protein [Candidatus Paceibacterota bacterium]MBP9840072.1 DUF1761 domain-containing protein [Candidatus Paceibacterota bacterium]